MSDSRPDTELVFNPHGRRHYRRSYSVVEARIGALIVLLLAGIAVWVAWRGGQPDPTVFGQPAALLDPGEAPVERGALPNGLAAAGFREAEVSHFVDDNLYEKINGRADFFRSRGFERLTFVKLEAEDDPALTVDIELYDMGAAQNALGTYGAEKAPETPSERDAGTVYHVDRNALFLARGRYYVRAIGADESERVLGQLEHLRARLHAGLPGAELPWAHVVFQGMHIDPSRLSYAKENAFSFGFANHVFSARLDDDETEVFVTVAADAEAAAQLAQQFIDGFSSYGERLELGDQVFVKDRYIDSLAAVGQRDVLVFGLRGAPAEEQAVAAFERVEAAVAALASDVLEQAKSSLQQAQAQP